MSNVEEDACMPIAVIGMGCRFPGDATSPDHLWELLANGRNAWSEFPKDRINIDGFYHPSGERQGSICFRGGHFLRDDVAAWDAPFFSTTAHEAAAMDPQQRILLEVSYEAFENAGIPMETLPGSHTAVYCGSFVKDYEQICLRDPDDSPQYAATGNGIAIMSNRISWFYDLRGPSMTLDTGCSASLVGVHLAAQSLRTGESKLAIAMGAGMILTPSTMLPMTALNFLSPDGKCFAFDERANGYGRGEGIGAVVLKPLADALRDNDTIRAVIRGSGVNQDGRTPGITMPSKEAQAMNIRAVYKAAGLGYDTTAYFEAHGTGTQAGDPTELGAISETFAEFRNPEDPIFVGSVKTNIGHLEGCAGIAGLVKGVLMLEKGQIPQNLYFENVNPRIDLDAWRIKIPQSLTPWPREGLRRASINCFGFGGTNAHIILDDAFHYLTARGLDGKHSSVDPSAPASPSPSDSIASLGTPPSSSESSWEILPATNKQQLLVLSSHEESGIGRLSAAYSEYLRAKNIGSMQQGESAQLARNLAYTLASRRSRLPWKSFLVSESPNALDEQFTQELSKSNRSSQPPNVAYIFSGQGAQWFAMGRELLQYQVFRNSLQDASVYLESIGSEWSLMTELLKDEESSIINLPRISQPLCTALQVALVDLLSHWNIKPYAVAGHSSGEIAAAYTIGAISRENAWKLAFHRGRLTSSIKFLAPQLKGKMMAVALSQDATEAYLSRVTHGKAIVACINSPENVTVSGDKDAVLELQQYLTDDGVFARLLKVDNAYHSFHMRTIDRHYLRSIEDVSTLDGTSSVLMFSSVTGKPVTSKDLGPAYWAENLISPVKFSEAVNGLLKSKIARPDVLLELGPHSVLQAPLKQILDISTKPKFRPSYFSMLHRAKDAVATSLNAAGNLWTAGALLDIGKVNECSDFSPKVLSDLPTYPWNHAKSYWHESHLGSSHRFRKYGRQDLIGAPTADSISFEPRWRGFLRVSENPWLQDHQVQNTIIYPAAGMMVMVLEAATQIQDQNRSVESYEISKMHIEKAMIIPTSAHGLETALNVKNDARGYEFVIYSKLLGADWIQNASGYLAIRYKDSLKQTSAEVSEYFKEYETGYLKAQEVCTESIPARQLYETLESIGMKYGPMFQNITSVKKKGTMSCTTVTIPDTLSRMPAKYEYPHLIHPATLDAMFQTVFVAGNEPMVPSFLESLVISAAFPSGAGTELEGYSSASRRGLRDATGTIVMSDECWKKPLLLVKNLHFTALSTTPENFAENGFLPNHHKLCAQLEWKENIDTAGTTSLSEWLRLLVFKNPNLNILELCDRHTPLICPVVKVIGYQTQNTPRLGRYTLAAGNTVDLEAAKENLAQWSDYIEWKSLDSQQGLDKQGFSLNSYDLVISHHEDLYSTTALVALLKPKGRLLKMNANLSGQDREDSFEPDLTTYQIRESEDRVNPKLPTGSVEITTSKDEASVIGISEAGQPDVPLLSIYTPAQLQFNLQSRETVLILPEKPSEELIKLAIRITDALLLLGAKASTTMLTNTSQQFSGKICIALLEVDTSLVMDWTNSEFDAFKLFIAQAKGCLWVTRGGQVNAEIPATSPANTLLRTIRSEDPQKSLYSLDLDPESKINSDATGAAIISVIAASFDPNLPSAEMEYAERDGKLLIPRLVLQDELSAKIERGDAQRAPRLESFSQEGRTLKLEVGSLGNLDSLCFIDDTDASLPLRSEDVEIRVEAVGINALDVSTAMGQSSSSNIGTDVSGIVTKIGSSVTRFKPGDRVAAVVNAGFSTLARCQQSLVQTISDNMPFEIAASLLTDVAIAYHSIVKVGRLEDGESVLIHCGGSGFGQAAVQIARHIGAEIFATFKSEKEREILVDTYGVVPDHILDWQSSHFSRAIRRLTDEKGVDLVLNTLGQEALEQSHSCVAEFGRFVELSASDEASNASKIAIPTLRNVTYSTIDFEHMRKKNPTLVSKLLRSGFSMIQKGFIKAPEQLKTVPISKISTAFEEARILTHGKVVVKFANKDLVPVIPRELHPLKLDPDATYVLVGGLGGLGRSLSRFMIKHGARHLAFLSRSGAISEEQIKFLEELKGQGVQGTAYKCDICDEKSLASAIARCGQEMPRINGLIQAAAVIRDSIFDNMTYTDWITATRPKMQGSWNLHQQMPKDLDFFVFLSSSAGVIGARGQANYASGNSYQDALATYRRSQGLAAVSLDLGLILGAGMVAEDEATLEMLRASGFFGIREKDFHILVSAAMTGYTEDSSPTPPQLIIGTGTGGLVLQNGVSDPYWYSESRFLPLSLIDLPPTSLSPSSQSTHSLLQTCSSPLEAHAIILEGLVTLLAKSMNMLPQDMDTQKPANAYGVDSLVAVGTRNWIFRETGVDTSVFEILSEGSIEVLVGSIVERGGFGGGDEGESE